MLSLNIRYIRNVTPLVRNPRRINVMLCNNIFCFSNIKGSVIVKDDGNVGLQRDQSLSEISCL